MNHLLLVLGFLPIVAEVELDRKLWREGKDDKPLSTILRYVFMAGLSIVFLIFGILTWWQAFIFMVFTHAAFFDSAINVFALKQGVFYHPDTNWWDRIWGGIASMRFGKIIYVFLRLWIYWVGFLLSFKWDLVQGNYITEGTWWEKISQFFMF